jgi:NAD(P)-dependent dehydrogenase (short-subunit alcohol dehydrogenase family)
VGFEDSAINEAKQSSATKTHSSVDLPNGNPILRSGAGIANRVALNSIYVAMNNKQTVVITGASSGIGLGLAKGCLAEGFNVVANSRRITVAGTLIPSNNLLLVDGDVGEPATARDLIHRAEQRFGKVDVLINNAGIFVPKPFVEYAPEDFHRVVSTNLAGFFYVSQAAVRHMLQKDGGQIINISTTLAQQPVAGVTAALTSLTKGGLDSVTRGLAIEYASRNIRVNAIAPGIVDTPMHKPENHEALKHLHPIHRLATVEEIVGAALFLVRAPFITGEVLYVDGGAHAGKW